MARCCAARTAEDRRLVLGQQAVDAASNEITAVPVLLDLLVLDEAIVTVDALHCQTATAVETFFAYLGRETEHWPDLGCVGMVVRERVTKTGTSRETSYYLSSLAATVATFARAVRSHWGIENREHWVLDVAFREDESRVRTGDGAENVGVLRRIALNLIRLDRSRKGSVHTKRLKAGWDQDYLLHLLTPRTQ